MTSNLKNQQVSTVAFNLEEYDLTPEGCINPFNKNNKLITVNWIENLLKKYGIFKNINDLKLYQRAFVHTSYTIDHIKNVCLKDKVEIVKNPDGCVLLQEKSYERLEFLGDTIIDAIIGIYIYNRFPNCEEGFLSLLKKKLISRWVLGEFAIKLNMPEYLIISKTLDDKKNYRENIKVCCDIFEAFVAAIYLDFNNNFNMAYIFVVGVLEHSDTLFDLTSYITSGTDDKTMLRNYSRRVKHSEPQYETIKITDSLFKTIIKIKNDIIAESTDVSYKKSQYTTAKLALNILLNTK